MAEGGGGRGGWSRVVIRVRVSVRVTSEVLFNEDEDDGNGEWHDGMEWNG